MSVARTARRRRRQASQGFTHIARLSPNKGCSRPIYSTRALVSVGEAIQREKAKAARIAAAGQKKKS